MIKHYILGNKYYVEQDGKIVLSCSLDQEKEQIIMVTEKEIYAGPISLISFKEDP